MDQVAISPHLRKLRKRALLIVVLSGKNADTPRNTPETNQDWKGTITLIINNLKYGYFKRNKNRNTGT